MAVVTYREALRQALREEMQRDERVFVLGEDVGAYGGTYAVTKGFLEEFGEKRLKDTPIAESAIVGAAIGAAMGGLRPVAELMTVNFTLLALDQIVNHAAKLHYMFGGQVLVPLVIRTPAGYGQLAATHSQTFENYFAYVPGLKVVAPALPADAKGMLKTAIRDPNPVIFMEHSLLYGTRGEVADGENLVPFGQSVVRRTGHDLTVVSYSHMLLTAMEAAERMAKEDGIEAEVIDLRSLRPLDMGPVIASVQKTNHALVVEEGWRMCGMGAEIASQVYEEAFDYLDAPVGRLAAKETPVPYARNLEKMVFPQVEDIIRASKTALARER